MGIPVDLSHQPAFYHIWMPRYNFLGARDERDKWSGLEADFRKMDHGPTRPPNKNLLPRDSLIRINRQNPVKKKVGRDFCQRLDYTRNAKWFAPLPAALVPYKILICFFFPLGITRRMETRSPLSA